MKPKRVDALPATDVEGGDSVSMRMLVGPDDGDATIALREFTMAPGGGMPLHTNETEHVQYVVSGRARVTVGDESHAVEGGMSLFVPAGVPHSYEAVGDAPFVFLCAIPIER